MERDNLTELMATNLRQAMLDKGTNAAELARSAGVNPTGVYDILSGKSRSPRLETVSKLARALGVPTLSLLESQNNETIKSQILHLFEQLGDDERERLIVTAEAWVALKSSAAKPAS